MILKMVKYMIYLINIFFRKSFFIKISLLHIKRIVLFRRFRKPITAFS